LSDQVQYSEYERRLGRHLCASLIATQLGIGIGYALKTYVRDTPGEYWLSLARRVKQDHLESVDRQTAPEPESGATQMEKAGPKETVN